MTKQLCFGSILLTLTLSALPARAASDRWIPYGPPAGVLTTLAVDSAGRLYTAATESGVYASPDGGRSWRWSGAGMGTERARAVAVDTAGGALFAMGESRFFRSTDRGQSWSVRSLNVPLGELVPGGDLLAVVPGGRTIFLARNQTLLRSQDGGATWKLLLRPATPMTALLVDPRNPRSLFVGTEQIGGLFHSADGGATWAEITNVQPSGPPPFENPFRFGIHQLSALPTSPTTLFALAGLSLYRSTDGGTSWRQVAPAPAPSVGYIDAVAARAGTAGAPATVFTLQQLQSDDGFSHHGLFASQDLGATWTRIDDGSGKLSGALLAAPDGELYSLAVDAVGHGESGGVHWRRFLIGSQFCGGSELFDRGGLLRWSRDGSKIYALVGFRLFVSTDGGRFWTARAQALSESCIKLSDVQIEPINPEHSRLYVSTDRGVFQSFDGGQIWIPTVPPVHSEDIRAFRALALLPGGSLVGGACGIDRSVNHGETWSETLSCDVLHPEYGEPDFLREVKRLRVDPKRPRVLYAEVAEEGERHPPVSLPYIYRSTDGGATWNLLAPEATGALTIAIDPKTPRILYLAKSTEILRSTDDGQTWTHIGSLGAASPAFDLLVDPVHSTILYSAGPLGVYRSTNSGATWSSFSTTLRERTVLNLFRDPRKPTLYAGAGGLFQTAVP